MVRMYCRAFFHWRFRMEACWDIWTRELSRWARAVLFSGKDRKKSLHLRMKKEDEGEGGGEKNEFRRVDYMARDFRPRKMGVDPEAVLP